MAPADEINPAKRLRTMDTKKRECLISDDNDDLLHLDNDEALELRQPGQQTLDNDGGNDGNDRGDNGESEDDDDDDYGGFLWTFDSNVCIGRVASPSALYECCRCGSLKVCIDLFHEIGHNVCRDCRWKYRDDYRTLHQSRVAYEYGLNSRDLGPLGCLVKPNKNTHRQDIKLYFKFQLEETCNKKHGSLQNWIQKREDKQLAKFKLLSATYERSVKPVATNLESKQCIHHNSTKTFNDGLWVETCPDCGHREEWEEL